MPVLCLRLFGAHHSFSPLYPNPAVGAYSPAVMALQNLISSQLSLTRHLVSQSQDLAGSVITSSIPDHQYMTLQSTKEVSDTEQSCDNGGTVILLIVFCLVHQ